MKILSLQNAYLKTGWVARFAEFGELNDNVQRTKTKNSDFFSTLLLSAKLFEGFSFVGILWA